MFQKRLGSLSIWFALAPLLVAASACGQGSGSAPPPPSPLTIVTFEDCARAGYPVMLSHPRRCLAPDGRVFIEPVVEAGMGGISGRIVIGPQCPVVPAGRETECADKPYQATVVVKEEGTLREMTRFTSDSTGAFRIPLPPGTYSLEPLAVGKPYPYGKPQRVQIVEGMYTEITISYDTGIR